MPMFQQRNRGPTSNHRIQSFGWERKVDKERFLRLRRAVEGIPMWYPTDDERHKVGEERLFQRILREYWIPDPWTFDEDFVDPTDEFYWPETTVERLKCEGKRLCTIYDAVSWLLEVEKLGELEDEELQNMQRWHRADVEEWAPGVALRRIVFHVPVDWNGLLTRIDLAVRMWKCMRTLRPWFLHDEIVTMLSCVLIMDCDGFNAAVIEHQMREDRGTGNDWMYSVHEIETEMFAVDFDGLAGAMIVREKEEVVQCCKKVFEEDFLFQVYMALKKIEFEKNTDLEWLDDFRRNDERSRINLRKVKLEILELLDGSPVPSRFMSVFADLMSRVN